MSPLNFAILILALGGVLLLLYFLTGIARGLGADSPGRQPLPARLPRASVVRGLLLLMAVSLAAGILFRRPLLLLLAGACLLLAYWLARRR